MASYSAHDRTDPEVLAGVPRRLLRRAITASAIGNATEWFDNGVYAYVAIYIGHNFFPGDHSTLAAMLTFAVTFVLRPLGGIVWGAVGDTLGRQRILGLTILVMSAATFGIGLLPTYATIGVWAPVLLIVLRVVQGFSTGGEYSGAATFMAEYAPDRSRGFCGSFLEFGTVVGFTAALAVVTVVESLVGEAAMEEWGWRVPFLVTALLGFVGFYLRYRMEETPVFRELAAAEPSKPTSIGGLRLVLARYRRQLFVLAGLVVALNVAYYTLTSYMPTYLQGSVGMSGESSGRLLLIGQLAMIVVMPAAGALSDRVGRKPCWWASLVGLFVLAIPMYLLMARGSAGAILGFAVLGVVFVLQLGTISATFPAMFPTHVRYLGFGVAYNCTTALFGGTAPAVNEWLIGKTGNELVPAFYLMGACAVGMVAMLFLVETAGASLRGQGLPGSNLRD